MLLEGHLWAMYPCMSYIFLNLKLFPFLSPVPFCSCIPYRSFMAESEQNVLIGTMISNNRSTPASPSTAPTARSPVMPPPIPYPRA